MKNKLKKIANLSGKSYYIWLLITVSFFIVTVLPHEIVGLAIAKIFENVPRAFYDNVVLIVAAIVTIAYGYYIYIRTSAHPERKKIGLIYLFVTFAFMVFCFNTLFVVNVEAIHYVQYAMMAALLFIGLKRYDSVIWICLILATIDEGYQYFLLSPERTMYFDFNDVILDMCGAGWGLSTLYIAGAASRLKAGVQHRALYLIYGTLILIGIILWSIGFIQIFPNGETMAPMQIFKFTPKKFWNVDRGVTYFHVVRPLAGVLILIALGLFYSFLDRFSAKDSK